ncbi:MAG: aspartate aminotransferase family protein [Coriobacteriia bacterium]|nr:aspartate aminotransferase family protein [Coriobacteriia bacterium]
MNDTKTISENTLPDEHHVMDTFARMGVELVRGEGMELFDAEGKRYYDFLSGIGVVGLGHSNPAVVKALTDQAQKLTHVSNFFYIEHRSELADKLAELFGVDANAKVFFANSGTEAVEGALKLARKWARENKKNAHTIVTARNSFHGRTFGAMSATGQPERNDVFAPLVPGFEFVAFNDSEALDAALGDKVIALMLEVIQGESGVWPATQEYLDSAQKWCKERNILLIIDEIQTGIYRTGEPFAFEHYGIEPDIIASAKGLGNGFPLGAFIAKDEVAAAFAPGDHGTTFGGGPLACAVALATLKEYEALSIDEVPIKEHVTTVGTYAKERLSELGCFDQVRGIGLMIGATLSENAPLSAPALRDALCDHGFIVNAIGDTIIRLLPPLICTNMHIDALIDEIYAIMNDSREETS